jgi:tetratricopeptide (TPR) repeat protein
VLGTTSSCATAPASPGKIAGAVEPLSDDLIAASVQAEVDPQQRERHLRLLRQGCDLKQLEACASLIGYLPAGAERSERHEWLLKHSADAGFFVWSALVFSAQGDARRTLALKASKRFPHSDLFISISEKIPARADALNAFISNPTFMTLMQLSLRLAQENEWDLLAEAMTLALYADVVDAGKTPEFWILRSRVASRTKRLDLVWAYSAMASIVRHRGKNASAHLSVVTSQAARHPDTLDLLPVLLSLPVARSLRADEDLLLTGLRAHRVKVQMRARELLAQPARSDDTFAQGLIAALVGTRFETDLRRKRRLLAEAVLQAPDNLQAWVRLAAIEDELKNIPEAIGSLRNALRVDGDNPESLNNLAYMLALHRPQDLEEAEGLARRSLVIRPSPKTLDTLAEICFRRQRQASALRFIRLAKTMEPKDNFYKRQEVRILAGDPKAPVPAEEE